MERHILHVDGDAFFASCEQAQNPLLRGRPVVTGLERGIVSAASYEAKALGITRATRLSDVRKICPEAVILPSDYETYSLYSRRMYEILRRFTPEVEEYGIDEAFGDLSGLEHMHHMSYAAIAASIKQTLREELQMTFSLGLAPTKVLAKLGSKWKKPNGLTIITPETAPSYLRDTPIENIWGIGRRMSVYLENHNIRTALELTARDLSWVREHLAKPYQEIWHELRSTSVLPLSTVRKDSYHSITKSHTFTPPSRSAAFVYSQLSKNVENACIKARRYGLYASEFSFFLKTQRFQYHTREVRLPRATHAPEDILAALQPHFLQIFQTRTSYRATGVTLVKLRPTDSLQLDFFADRKKKEKVARLYTNIDRLATRYGKHTVFLGSSMRAITEGTHTGERATAPARHTLQLKGESARKRLSVPFLGEVS